MLAQIQLFFYESIAIDCNALVSQINSNNLLFSGVFYVRLVLVLRGRVPLIEKSCQSAG